MGSEKGLVGQMVRSMRVSAISTVYATRKANKKIRRSCLPLPLHVCTQQAVHACV